MTDRTEQPSASTISIFCEYIHPHQNSTGYYWDSIIRKLGASGHPIRVIAPRFNAAPVAPYPTGVVLDDFPSRDYDTASPINRLLGQTAQAMQLAWKLVFALRRDHTLLSGTNPAISVLTQATLKKLLGFRWVLLVHDLFPNNLIPAGLSSPNRWSYRIAHGIFRWAFLQADRLIVIGRDMEEVLAQRGIPRHRVSYIRNWVDLHTISPGRRAIPPSIWTPPSGIKKMFVFFGNMGRLQGLSPLLEAIRIANLRDAAFLFMGKGALAELVQTFCTENPHLNCHYSADHPGLTPAEALTLGDVALVPLIQGMFGIGVPSKACFCLAAGKPMLYIGDEASELHQVIRESGAGWFCRSGDAQALALVLREITYSSDLPSPTLCRATAERLYDQRDSLLQVESVVCPS